MYSSADGFASHADVAACREMLRGGSRTFFAASLVLPGSVRKPAAGLYAFCRMADDAIDQGTDRAAALRDLHVRLERIYARMPGNSAADRAFGVFRRSQSRPPQVQYAPAAREGTCPALAFACPAAA